MPGPRLSRKRPTGVSAPSGCSSSMRVPATSRQTARSERSGELAGAAATIADVRRQIADKEAEIAQVRGDGADEGGSDTVESSAEEVADQPSAETPTGE